MLSSSAVLTLNGPTQNDLFGLSAKSAGDLDGDTYSEVAISATLAPGDPLSYAQATGRLFVFHGDQRAAQPEHLGTIDADLTIYNPDPLIDYFGVAVELTSDQDSDGVADLLVTSLIDPGTPQETTAVQVYSSVTGGMLWPVATPPPGSGTGRDGEPDETYPPVDENGDPILYGHYTSGLGIYGDATRDLRVEEADLVLVSDAIGDPAEPGNPVSGDLTLSGTVDMGDLNAVVGQMNQSSIILDFVGDHYRLLTRWSALDPYQYGDYVTGGAGRVDGRSGRADETDPVYPFARPAFPGYDSRSPIRDFGSHPGPGCGGCAGCQMCCAPGTSGCDYFGNDDPGGGGGGGNPPGDCDGDGEVDPGPLDSDCDGIPDSDDCDQNGSQPSSTGCGDPCADDDGDGVPNQEDCDSPCLDDRFQGGNPCDCGDAEFSLSEVFFYEGTHTIHKDSDGSAYEKTWRAANPDESEPEMRNPLAFTMNRGTPETEKITVSAVVFEAAYSEDFDHTAFEVKATGAILGVPFDIDPVPLTRGFDFFFATDIDLVDRPSSVQTIDEFEIQWEILYNGNAVQCVDGMSSRNDLYFTQNDPVAFRAIVENPDGDGYIASGNRLYHTALHIGCSQASDSGINTTAENIVNSIYDLFETRNVARAEDDKQMTYWKSPAETCPQFLPQMLAHEEADGACTAWAELMCAAILSQGISDVEIWQIRTKWWAPATGSGEMMIPDWLFAAGAGSAPLQALPFNYLLGECAPSQVRVPAQGNDDSPENFGNHYIVAYGGTLYDPSYGSVTAAIDYVPQTSGLEKYLFAYETRIDGYFRMYSPPVGADYPVFKREDPVPEMIRFGVHYP